MSEAENVFTTSDRRAAEVLRVLERARGNLATPDGPALRATVEPQPGEVAVRLVLSTANPAAEAAAESLVASGHALESLVVTATQRLVDLQHAEERILRELSESVQTLRRQTEAVVAWRAPREPHRGLGSDPRAAHRHGDRGCLAIARGGAADSGRARADPRESGPGPSGEGPGSRGEGAGSGSTSREASVIGRLPPRHRALEGAGVLGRVKAVLRDGDHGLDSPCALPLPSSCRCRGVRWPRRVSDARGVGRR